MGRFYFSAENHRSFLRRTSLLYISPGGKMNMKSEFITKAPLSINIPVDRSYKSASMRKLTNTRLLAT